MSNVNIAVRWIMFDGYGQDMGGWVDEPTEDQIRICLEAKLEETMGPFILVEAVRRQVWEAEFPGNSVYRVDMPVPPAPAARTVQSGPRKVIIR